MNNEYFCLKEKYHKKDISFMYLIFGNGDYISLKGLEIVDFSVNTYDRLVKYDNGYTHIVANGFIKLKIYKKVRFAYNQSVVYNQAEFKKDRKKYIEDRCTKENEIKEVWIFNKHYHHRVLLGNIVAKMDGEFLLLQFLPIDTMGSCLSNQYNIRLGDVRKEHISHIDLDFENCDGITVYDSEILDIKLDFDNLIFEGSAINRRVSSGYLIIKLCKDYNRRFSLYKEKNVTLKDFEQRLCGKKGFSDHDICHLYITYNHPGWGSAMEECLSTEDIRYIDDVVDNNFGDTDNCDDYDEFDCDDVEFYQSGYCKKLKNGSLVITFGKNAKEDIAKFE